ncbi:MAG TPA: hypothetical protein VK911_03300 [Vicinamibacterales bacterium]|nr:hypothetical protein [Vicinamibacterales bacterium]
MPQLPYVDPLPLPGPAWLLWSLLMLTFVLHVTAMNLLFGGAIIGAISRSRSRRSADAARLSGLLAHALPVLVAATVTFGVAALLFLQVLYGRLFFTAAVLLAVPWFSVILILIAAYYGTYYASIRGKAGAGASTAAAWAVTLAFAVIAFIYSNVMSLVLRPQEFLARAQASGTGFHLNLADPTLIPRYLHVLVGALALAGLGIALWGVVVRRRDAAFGAWMTGHGVYWAAGATMVNFLPGFWWLAALPREALLGLLGQNVVATIIFAVAILASLGALALLVPAAFAPDPRRLLLGAAASLSLTVVLMVLVRDAARRMILAPTGFRTTTWVEPQWGPIAIFGVLLVAGLGAVAWMVFKLAQNPAGGAGAPTVHT